MRGICLGGGFRPLDNLIYVQRGAVLLLVPLKKIINCGLIEGVEGLHVGLAARVDVLEQALFGAVYRVNCELHQRRAKWELFSLLVRVLQHLLEELFLICREHEALEQAQEPWELNS